MLVLRGLLRIFNVAGPTSRWATQDAVTATFSRMRDLAQRQSFPRRTKMSKKSAPLQVHAVGMGFQGTGGQEHRDAPNIHLPTRYRQRFSECSCAGTSPDREDLSISGPRSGPRGGLQDRYED